MLLGISQAVYTKSPLTPVECDHCWAEVQQLFIISQGKGTTLDQKQVSTHCPTERVEAGGAEYKGYFSHMEAKLTKDEQIQLLHLMIQLIVFSSHLAIAPLMHRTADDAHPIHGRNHCPPIFFSHGSSSSLFGLTFFSKSSAAARYLCIRSGCSGDFLSVIRRR